jgi:hypothetical protein
MNLKEYAIEKAISLAEAKLKTGLSHWKQEVVETESQEGVVVSEKEAIIPDAIKTESQEPTLTVADARATRGNLGDKDRGFLRLIRDNATNLPEEYKRIKGLIERYL